MLPRSNSFVNMPSAGTVDISMGEQAAHAFLKPTTKPNAFQAFFARISTPIVNVINSGISAETLALSFALGMTCGLFPVPGITSVVGALFTWFLKANLIASTAVNYIMTPFNLACLIPFIRAGEWIFFIQEPVPFSMEPFSKSLFGALSLYSGCLARAIVAWFIFFPFATLFLYYALYFVLRPIVDARKVTA